MERKKTAAMIFNLQVLRALAAMIVVTHHFDLILFGVAGPAWLQPGHTGVDVFFVISGFVMVYTTARRPMSAADFMANRVVRVAPLYWIVTLLLAGYFVVRTAAHRTMTLPLVLKSLLFIPDRDYTGYFYPVLYQGWTLDYEMVFYLLFAAGLGIFKGRIGVVVAVLSGLLGVVAAGGAAFGTAPAMRTTLFDFYTNSIIIEFAFGMLLAVIFLRGGSMPRAAAAALMAVGAIVLIGSSVLVPVTQRGLIWGLPSTAIVAGAIYLERGGWALRNRTAQLIGASSYALYLVHPLVLLGANKAARLVSDPAARVGLAVVTMIVSVIVAVLVHVWLERPLTDRLRRLIGHRPMVTERADPSAPARSDAGTAVSR